MNLHIAKSDRKHAGAFIEVKNLNKTLTVTLSLHSHLLLKLPALNISLQQTYSPAHNVISEWYPVHTLYFNKGQWLPLLNYGLFKCSLEYVISATHSVSIIQ